MVIIFKMAFFVACGPNTGNNHSNNDGNEPNNAKFDKIYASFINLGKNYEDAIKSYLGTKKITYEEKNSSDLSTINGNVALFVFINVDDAEYEKKLKDTEKQAIKNLPKEVKKYIVPVCLSTGIFEIDTTPPLELANPTVGILLYKFKNRPVHVVVKSGTSSSSSGYYFPVQDVPPAEIEIDESNGPYKKDQKFENLIKDFKK